MKIKFLMLLFCGLFISAFAQEESAPENWFNLDPADDEVYGVSTAKMYDFLQNKKAQTVVVAVIDGGVDPMHEDLKDVMWVNEDEIPDNGKDDDNNGYVDDVYGWNFAGGPDGKSVNHDTYELTRLYAKYHKMFEDANPDNLKGKEKKKYQRYLDLKKSFEKKKAELEEQSGFVMGLWGLMQDLRETYGDGEITIEQVNEFEPSEDQSQSMFILKSAMANGAGISDLEGELEGAVEYFENSLKYGYNPDFTPRAGIVGDDYSNPNERYYGNNDVKGPDAFHGTHVAGIIAAARGNGKGIDGVAHNVRIMAVRAVPNGDERDKDVANAIRYAVDNGASVINMSFGKSYSWNESVVEEAIKYARKNDVLLIHAAGNDAKDNDATDNFPNDSFEKRGFLKLGPKSADNWLEVGAVSWQSGESLPASFTNYGKQNVDVFAPGVDILSTAPDGEYEEASGTSMAAPVTSGVAAVIRGYFPELTAQQVKEVIMNSTEPITFKVMNPGTGEQVMLSDMSVTGGIVNAYKAVQLADNTKGKNKS